MRKIIAILLGALVLAGIIALTFYWSKRQVDAHVAKFNQDADNLIQGLQQYKEFVGTYPQGNNPEIAKAMSGQTEKKVLILVMRKSELNARGEIVDPWGTPLQFYFAPNSILIRSAGPNKIFEDSKNPKTDDLFRSN